MNCFECRFSHPHQLDDGIFVLQCRRHPPQITWDDSAHEAVQVWPQVTDFDWCGEHEPAASVERQPGASAMNIDEIDLIEPQTIDEARLQMVRALHRALFGDVWARSQTPSEIWSDLLRRVKMIATAVRR